MKHRLRLHPARDPHQAFYQDIVALLNKHARHLNGDEILAIAANLLGKLIALQDQRTMTREAALAIVRRNIEEGNAEAIAQIADTKGSA